MSKKTILHLTGAISTKYGSFEKFLLEFSKQCTIKGYKTILQYEKKPYSKEYLDELHNNNIDVIIKPINTNPILSIITLTKIIKNESPDIIQTHFINGLNLVICPIIAKFLKTKKIFHMQHLYSNFEKIPLIKYIFNSYNKVFCISQAIAEDLRKAGVKPEIISQNYLGLLGEYKKSEIVKNHLRKKFNIPSEATVFSCIAFDNPVKGVDILLKGFKKIIEEFPGVYLVIIGIDPQISKLFKLSNKLKLSNYVVWVGITDHAIETLNVSDIYVQPSRKEGLGLAIIEAMALQLPIIATKTGGIPEAVIESETGYLVTPNSSTALVEAMKQMLLNPVKTKKLGKNGYQRYQQLFKGEKSIIKFLKIYNL